MSGESFETRLAAMCREAFGAGELQGLARLSGGANMESWSFDWGGRGLVLRRLPAGMLHGADPNLGAIGLDAQAELIEIARRAGVRAPAVLARLHPHHGLGQGFVMARVEGETLPQRILGKPAFAAAEGALVEECARELARIHSLGAAQVPGTLRLATPLELVHEQAQRYIASGAALPAFDHAFGWLERHAPEPVPPAVLHGDFRMGNLVIDANGIAAVLDWELAHLGDPAQDLAYLCTPSWRFGHYERPVGGFGEIDALLEAYARASGRRIEPARLQWWLVYGTLWWGMVCLAMGQMWRSGADRSLERAVVGRRVSEVELDLLLLFDPGGAPDLAWSPPAAASAGEIGHDELLTAVHEWARGVAQTLPAGHAQFEARVALNALGMAQRQAAAGAALAREAEARLDALKLDHAGLCHALYDGRLTLDAPGVWTHLRLAALERLGVDQPASAGLRHARKRWLVESTAPRAGS